MKAPELYDFTVQTIDGEARSLADYRGHTLLVVNTASRCGFTPQYESLEALYERYKSRGFVVHHGVRDGQELFVMRSLQFSDDLVRRDDDWKIHLNSDYIPRLRISSTYRDLIAKGTLSKEERDYLGERMRSGKPYSRNADSRTVRTKLSFGVVVHSHRIRNRLYASMTVNG